MRQANLSRKTAETDVYVSLNLDGSGHASINTGVGFLDHMLSLAAFHGMLDLTVRCRGDVSVDTHHTAEDVGLCIGSALREALGDCAGIERYGFALLPMDEALAQVALDISGRACLMYDVKFARENLGGLASEDVRELFAGLAASAMMTVHMAVLCGLNDHHKAEAVFKGFGRALKSAVALTSERLPSTKGVM